MRRTLAFGIAVVLLVGSCGGGTTPINEVGVGACFDDPDTAIVTELELVDCFEPHDNEIFAELFMTETVFPGDDVVAKFAFDACLPEFEAYVGQTYADSSLDYFYFGPTQQSWGDGDRGVQCVLYSADFTKLTGSMQRA